MKILVDTCVWSLALMRRESAELNAQQQSMVSLLREAIEDGRVAMVGPIRQEILSGVKDPGQFATLNKTLRAFPDQDMAMDDYVEAGRLYNLCRGQGLARGPIDMLLCALALRRGWRLLTIDGGILRCCAVIRERRSRPEACSEAGSWRRSTVSEANSSSATRTESHILVRRLHIAMLVLL